MIDLETAFWRKLQNAHKQYRACGFYDHVFKLNTHGDITFDSEVKPHSLGISPDDVFCAQIDDEGCVCLRKLT